MDLTNLQPPSAYASSTVTLSTLHCVYNFTSIQFSNLPPNIMLKTLEPTVLMKPKHYLYGITQETHLICLFLGPI